MIPQSHLNLVAVCVKRRERVDQQLLREDKRQKSGVSVTQQPWKRSVLIRQAPALPTRVEGPRRGRRDNIRAARRAPGGTAERR